MSDTHWAFRASAALMTNFLSQKKPVEVSSDPEPPTEEDESDDDLLDWEPAVAAHLVYESDVPDDELLEDLADDDPVESSRKAEYEPITVASKGRVRRKLDIPVLKARENVCNEHPKWLQQALDDIEKLIKSKQTYFDAGQKSLQLYWALAIQSHLRMVVQNGWGAVDASEIAAESHGFAKDLGWLPHLTVGQGLDQAPGASHVTTGASYEGL